MLSPFVIAVKVTPIDTETQLKMAIDVSVLTLYFSLYFKSKTPAITTIGNENSIADKSNDKAIDKDAKATFESPTPIIEYFFKTRVIPKRLAQTQIKSPTIIALTIKG
ncbi:hypothetical protein HMPREF3188_01107 [Tissierellia bacterium KA00581]|nr:hypothetical protein HMPREF3188_01107 [Tissierellia bacterium KA00581]